MDKKKFLDKFKKKKEMTKALTDMFKAVEDVIGSSEFEINKDKFYEAGTKWVSKAFSDSEDSLDVSEFIDIYKAEKEKKPLNKPMRAEGNKKFKVYVKDPKTGNVKTVRFGDPNMEIKRDDKERRKNFRARHNCADKKDKTKAGYWSCKMWQKKTSVKDMTKKSLGEELNYISHEDFIDACCEFLAKGKIKEWITQDWMNLSEEEFEKAGRCWEGYEPVPGKKPYSDGSCRKKKSKKKDK